MESIIEFSTEELQELREQYTVAELAAMYSVSKSTIQRHLRKHGLIRSKRHAASYEKFWPIIKGMLDGGWTITDISLFAGVERHVVYTLMHYYGYDRNALQGTERYRHGCDKVFYCTDSKVRYQGRMVVGTVLSFVFYIYSCRQELFFHTKEDVPYDFGVVRIEPDRMISVSFDRDEGYIYAMTDIMEKLEIFRYRVGHKVLSYGIALRNTPDAKAHTIYVSEQEWLCFMRRYASAFDVPKNYDVPSVNYAAYPVSAGYAMI